ncbi:CHAT domain-containing tetratricopeptide repeat protein [Mesobacterium pallidum]|uniref:CHAT domain-containing tetratricopeptide repeat protein n=1 Tax=Mesobacterium pallidum TaxID=2872037 RepID=UPI001EE2BDBC|nr:CHAT domain-containing protein [Mesobacterium pallidum]
MRGLVRVMIVALTFLAGAATAEDLQGADATQRAEAHAGDPYAAFNYVAPLIDGRRLSEAQIEAILPYLRTAYDGWHGSDDPDEQFNAAVAARQLGAQLWQVARLAESLDWAATCIRHLLALGVSTDDQRVLAAQCYEDRAIVLQQLERHAESLPLLDQAEAFYRRGLSDADMRATAIANLQLNRGVGLDGLKRYRKAIAAYEQAHDALVALNGPGDVIAAYAANNTGVSHWRLKEFAAAEDWITRALPVMEAVDGPLSDTVGKARMNLGIILQEQGRNEEALRWGMSGMPYIAANRTQSLPDQRWLFEMFSRAHAALGDRERAIFFGKMAVNAQQELRALNAGLGDAGTEELRAEWRRLYQELADLLIAEGRISEAQAVLNMEKEEEVFEFLRRDGGAGLTGTRAILTDAELGVEQKLAALAAIPVAAEREVRVLYAKLDAGAATEADEEQLILLEDALQLATDRFDAEVEAFLADMSEGQRAAAEAQFDAIGAYQDVLDGLDRPTAILQVAAMEDRLHLFLTLPAVTLHETVDIARADLARQVFDALQAIETRSPEAVELLGGLQTALFAPVRPALDEAGIEVVMLNLDGFLRYVPFAALHDGTGYLVERFAFSLYSAAVPTQFARASRAADSAAGFGVTQGHPGFDPLPGVADEIETIFAAADGQGVLTGNAALDEGFDGASLRRVLMRKPEILHIASHFALNPGQEDDSFLLMGDGSHLTLGEIRDSRAFRFRGVDLLTLSACQTARGGDGSEIDGFGATAQLNGASAVMASLWPVADAATPILMRDFYAGMVTEGLDKAEALRRAQVAMLRGDMGADGATRGAAALESDGAGFAHPYFWSAFVLMGNWL